MVSRCVCCFGGVVFICFLNSIVLFSNCDEKGSGVRKICKTNIDVPFWICVRLRKCSECDLLRGFYLP